jgi:hypothetical protein
MARTIMEYALGRPMQTIERLHAQRPGRDAGAVTYTGGHSDGSA